MDAWDAFSSWHSTLLANEAVMGVATQVFNALSKVSPDDVVGLDGLHNVWCLSGLDENDLVLLNIIQTAE